eukprot:3301299-Rhodomonas_salina.1
MIGSRPDHIRSLSTAHHTLSQYPLSQYRASHSMRENEPRQLGQDALCQHWTECRGSRDLDDNALQALVVTPEAMQLLHARRLVPSISTGLAIAGSAVRCRPVPGWSRHTLYGRTGQRVGWYWRWHRRAVGAYLESLAEVTYPASRSTLPFRTTPHRVAPYPLSVLVSGESSTDSDWIPGRFALTATDFR